MYGDDSHTDNSQVLEQAIGAMWLFDGEDRGVIGRVAWEQEALM